MNITWQFQRSDQPVMNDERAVRCEFHVIEPSSGTESMLVMVMTESAALGMRNDLSQVLGGLTIATSMGDN